MQKKVPQAEEDQTRKSPGTSLSRVQLAGQAAVAACPLRLFRQAKVKVPVVENVGHAVDERFASKRVLHLLGNAELRIERVNKYQQ